MQPTDISRRSFLAIAGALPFAARLGAASSSVPVGIELSAYRIVQEALTNALKHAGRAHASVSVRYGPDSLELEIADDGAGRPTWPRSCRSSA